MVCPVTKGNEMSRTKKRNVSTRLLVLTGALVIIILARIGSHQDGRGFFFTATMPLGSWHLVIDALIAIAVVIGWVLCWKRRASKE